MNGNTTVTANFTQDAYTLTVVSAHGPVTKDPDQPTYTYGTEVELTMGTVDAGWTFTGWSEAAAPGLHPCTVTMNGEHDRHGQLHPGCLHPDGGLGPRPGDQRPRPADLHLRRRKSS